MNENLNLNLNKIPKELHLIFELLKKNKAIEPRFFKDIDWDIFMSLAMHHRVYPVLYYTIKGMDERVNIPTYVMEDMEDIYIRNTFKMLHFSAEMEQISKLFTYDHIRILFLKGPNVGYDLYGDISLRTSGDLDVLIPMDELERADRLLEREGYIKDDYIKTVLNDWKWRHHHVTYLHPEKRIKLEIHWRLHPGPGKEPIFNELWARKTKTELTTFPVYTLKHEDLFLYLVSHGARHGWSRLRWLIDIHQLLEKELDWLEINRLQAKYYSKDVNGQAIILASEILKSEIPTDVCPSLVNKKSIRLAEMTVFYLESMINLHTDPVPHNVARYHKRYLFSLMPTKQKLLFIISFLHPYPEDADMVRLPKTLHFLYFPLRPFLWAWRKARQTAFS